MVGNTGSVTVTQYVYKRSFFQFYKLISRNRSSVKFLKNNNNNNNNNNNTTICKAP